MGRVPYIWHQNKLKKFTVLPECVGAMFNQSIFIPLKIKRHILSYTNNWNIYIQLPEFEYLYIERGLFRNL